jgi:transcriptional regulator with XRE-family HTH domain
MQRRTLPENLPKCFAGVWEELSKADSATGSRRKLAAALGVSTHTLQRILSGENLPDLAVEKSSYILSSWTRTLARIACGLGLDPFALLESAGLDAGENTRDLVHAERSKLESRKREPSQVGGMPDLAGFIMALAGSWPGAATPSGSEALKQLQVSLARFLIATGCAPPGMADGSDLSTGSFCRSCMASLSDPDNRGISHDFCRWCSDSEGNLRSPEEVHEILTKWFMRWQNGITGSQASERARHYMLAMPAWSGSREH